jgi:hypothetical protein
MAYFQNINRGASLAIEKLIGPINLPVYFVSNGRWPMVALKHQRA